MLAPPTCNLYKSLTLCCQHQHDVSRLSVVAAGIIMNCKHSTFVRELETFLLLMLKYIMKIMFLCAK